MADTILEWIEELPISSDAVDRLKRSLAAYRMVFGQPRQEDLMAFLGRHIGLDALDQLGLQALSSISSSLKKEQDLERRSRSRLRERRSPS